MSVNKYSCHLTVMKTIVTFVVFLFLPTYAQICDLRPFPKVIGGYLSNSNNYFAIL